MYFRVKSTHMPQEAYKQNFGEKPRGDITQIEASKIPKHDILCAGFPCQPFSISGNQDSISDPRGRLFYEILRVAEYHRPLILLLENVKNILSIDNGNVVKTIKQELTASGYTVHHHVLNASNFGVPQARERVYFVALRKDIHSMDNSALYYQPPQETRKDVYLENILEKTVDNKFILSRDDIRLSKDDAEIECKLQPIQIGIVNKGSQGERIYSTKGHAITQSAYGGGAGARTGLYKTSQGIRRLYRAEEPHNR